MLSTKAKIFVYVAYLVLLVVFAAVLGEVVVRARGTKPWGGPGGGGVVDDKPLVEPGGKFYEKHDTRGWVHLPGEFKVTLKDGYSFKVTHRPDTLRITRPLAAYAQPTGQPQLWIFGCSYTHGWSLNDEDTYAWKLQERLPGYEVVNFGVNGYGTINSLIQLREALPDAAPAVVVLAYARFHDERNTFLRFWRKRVAPAPGFGTTLYPYARLDAKGQLVHRTVPNEYTEFPLMRHSALMNYLETRWNTLEQKFSRGQEVSQKLILEMAELSRRHGARFILAMLVPDEEMQAFAREHDIALVDISVPMDEEKYTNLPHDIHPGPLATTIYADRLAAFLGAETTLP